MSENQSQGNSPDASFSLFQEVDPFIGTTIDDRFRILECIGRGSLSVAYKTRDTKAGELRVLKKVHKHIAENIRSLKNLEQDLRKMINSCQGQHLTSYIDVFLSQSNDLYLISPSTPFITLESLLTKLGRLPLSDAMDLAVSACQGLCEGHKSGYFHKSMKPSNFVYLSSEPAKGNFELVKLADFGVAQLIASHSISKSQVQFMTHGRETMGSPMYFSPELCQGTSGDGRSDIYSFACVLYEVLTGKPPFVGKNAIETAYKHLKDDPAPMNLLEWQESENAEVLCARIESIIDKCLKKEPEDRYQKSTDLYEDLVLARSATEDQWKEKAAVHAVPQKLIAGRWKIPHFNTASLILPLVAVCGLLVGITSLWLFFVTNNFNASMNKYPAFSDSEMWLVTKTSNTANKDSFNARRDTALDALQLVRSEHGINSEDYAGALAALVELYANSGYWKEAQQRLVEMLDVTERVKGPWPKSQLYRILGYVQFMQDHNDEAEASCQKALTLMEEEKATPETKIQPLKVLGNIYSSKNEFDKAIETYEKLYNVVSSLKEKEAANFCDTASHLADVYRRRGDMPPSEKYYKEGLDWWESHGKVASLYASKSLYGYALVLAKQGKNTQAQEALSRAIVYCQEFPGKKSGLMGAAKKKYVELLWKDKPIEALKICIAEKGQ